MRKYLEILREAESYSIVNVWGKSIEIIKNPTYSDVVQLAKEDAHHSVRLLRLPPSSRGGTAVYAWKGSEAVHRDLISALNLKVSSFFQEHYEVISQDGHLVPAKDGVIDHRVNIRDLYHLFSRKPHVVAKAASENVDAHD